MAGECHAFWADFTEEVTVLQISQSPSYKHQTKPNRAVSRTVTLIFEPIRANVTRVTPVISLCVKTYRNVEEVMMTAMMMLVASVAAYRQLAGHSPSLPANTSVFLLGEVPLLTCGDRAVPGWRR